jgi:excisionase family DNA binding protein
VRGVSPRRGAVRLAYSQAAAHLGIKIGTLRSMVCHQSVPHIRLGPRLVVFDSEQLDAWLAERAVPSRKAG